MTGIFIAFDGMPGSGKGTMIKNTFQYLYDKSKKFDNILVTDEPTNGPYGLEIRDLFKKQKSSDDFKDELFELFAKDREWHINEIIIPLLEKNFVIIADRYKYSSIAYQTTQGTDFEKVFNKHRNFLAPTITFILDVSPENSYSRINSAEDEKRKDTDKFRELDFISNLRSLFLSMPEKLPNERIVIIDANKPIENVFEQIQKYLQELL